MAQQLPNLPLFITGHPRSGTTLLRLIFNKHSQIAVPDETGMFHWFYKRPWYKRFTRSKIPMPSAKSRAFGDDIITKFNAQSWQLRSNPKKAMDFLYGQYALNVNKPFWGDKTPLHTQFTEQIFALYPNAFIINLIRDPRAVASSAKRNLKKKRAGTDFWISSNLNKTVDRWKWELGLINKFTGKYPQKSIKVIYEDFVSNPEYYLKQICEQIGVQFELEMLNYHEDSHTEIKEMKDWHKETTKPINSGNINKWQNELTEMEIASIESALHNEMKEIGYLK